MVVEALLPLGVRDLEGRQVTPSPPRRARARRGTPGERVVLLQLPEQAHRGDPAALPVAPVAHLLAGPDDAAARPCGSLPMMPMTPQPPSRVLAAGRRQPLDELACGTG